ncbi:MULTISPECIES: hypothetical protein [unclassified Arthrobacter]|uniref:hypothetical protein n=1 Tax=unclassified Arthrobacter TaxID=235627 RepID=UPI000CE4FBBF|nr:MULTISPECIES: hypothetical protein [unclassified Arthrobacter]
MDSGVVFGVVVAIIGVVVAIVAFLHQNPRRHVALSTKETKFISEEADGFDGITISHAGQEVKDPRFIDVSVQATGMFDVPSDRFDSANPMVMKCETPILAHAGGEGEPVKISEDRKSIAIGPMLLKKGVPTTVRLLVDGSALCSWEEPKLIDTKFQIVSDATKEIQSQRARKRLRLLLTVLMVELVVLGLLTIATFFLVSSGAIDR